MLVNLISALMLIAGVPSLRGMAYSYLLPAFPESVPAAGSAGLGVLQSAVGISALTGALSIASLPSIIRSSTSMLLALFVLGGGLIAFGLSASFALSAALLFAVGVGQMVYNSLRQTFVQGLVADEMRGRVLSLLLAILVRARFPRIRALA